ncbi:MAG TPA: ATP-dependent metallopeptidase FtsH/Yme1/Tma family protein [Actinomycetota bacterium]|nr:ATP-dependent metallopeptidase FtsH/Yme1/Tma family protein [Actinomycetota bacterium]
MEGPPPTPAPPPPPRWRGWLLIAGLILTVVLFLVPVPSSGKVEQLSYAQLKSDLAAGQVASVAIGPDGDISGKLTNGTKFTSSYPTNLQDPQFARLLDQHNVQVTTKPAQTSIWSVLLNLLPLAIILSLFIWTGRSARRQLAGMGDRAGAVAGVRRRTARHHLRRRRRLCGRQTRGHRGRRLPHHRGRLRRGPRPDPARPPR